MVNYIAKINDKPIGGTQFDDNTTRINAYIIAATTLNGGNSITIDVSSYIPADGFQYEVLLIAYAIGSNNAEAAYRIAQGTSASNNTQHIIGVRGTHSNASNTAHKSMPFYFRENDARKITIKNTGTGNGTIRIGFANKRRLGNISNISNNITNVNCKGTSIPFGGEINDGVPVALNTNLFSGVSLASNGTRTVSLVNILPNDGYDYEVELLGWGNTGSTSGNSATFHVNGGTLTPIALLGSAITRFSSSYDIGGDANVVVSSNRNLIITNQGNAAGTFSLSIVAYKRMSKPATGDYISKINNNIVGGGDSFSGKWVTKGVSVLSAVTYTDSSTVTRNYTVSNYLPDNTYRYEVMGMITAGTATSAGSAINISISGGLNSVSGVYKVTRENYAQFDANVYKLICKQSNGTLTISTTSRSSKSGNIYLQLIGYRKIGTAGNL